MERFQRSVGLRSTLYRWSQCATPRNKRVCRRQGCNRACETNAWDSDGHVTYRGKQTTRGVYRHIGIVGNLRLTQVKWRRKEVVSLRQHNDISKPKAHPSPKRSHSEVSSAGGRRLLTTEAKEPKTRMIATTVKQHPAQVLSFLICTG